VAAWIRLAASVVGTLAVLLIVSPPAFAGTAAVSGMNGWSLHGLSWPDLNSQLDDMESQGVKVLRVDASWSSLEPNAPGANGPVYDFSGEDAEVYAIASHHMRWLPILDYSAPWAAGNPGDWRSPPADNAQFASYAAAVAARYGVGGSFWAQYPQLPYEPVHMYEVWNEENGDYFWDSGVDPAAYAHLYLTTRSALHAVDPAAQVIVGGLTNPQGGLSALQFISDMYHDVPSLTGNVDGIGVHPYAWNAAAVVDDVVEVRELLDSFGESAVPLEITEFGWRTGDSAAEQQRATMMADVAGQLANSNCGIGLLAPYDWTDPSYITDRDWGLAGDNGMRPAGSAWFAGLGAAASVARVQLCPASASSSGDDPSGSPPADPARSDSDTSATGTATSATAPPATVTPAKPVVKAPAKKATRRKRAASTTHRTKRAGRKRRSASTAHRRRGHPRPGRRTPRTTPRRPA
jgi:hypothetical protein